MSKSPTPPLFGQCISEFLGSALFLFIGASVVACLKLAGASYGQWEISLVWGLGVALAIYLTAGISGAHLNPAVTLSFWIFAKFEGRKVIPYMISQLIGTFCGAAVSYLLFYSLFTNYEAVHHIVLGSVDSLQLAGIFSTYPHPALSFAQAFLVELVITAVLMGVIMAITDDDNGLPNGPLAPLLIGVLVAVIGAALGPLTGFALNPARDFGPKLFTALVGWGKISLTGNMSIPYCLVPIFATIIGALIGAFIYRKAIAPYIPSKNSQ